MDPAFGIGPRWLGSLGVLIRQLKYLGRNPECNGRSQSPLDFLPATAFLPLII